MTSSKNENGRDRPSIFRRLSSRFGSTKSDTPDKSEIESPDAAGQDEEKKESSVGPVETSSNHVKASTPVGSMTD